MSILRKIWAIYAVILFLVMMFFSIPYLLFNMAISPGKRALQKNIYYLHHVFTPIFLALIGVRLKIHGLENLDPNQSYIIVANHRSALDFIINARAYPGVLRFLAKQELVKIPVFGWVVKKMCLMVDRQNARSRAQSLIDIRNEIKSGWSILIYPEGGRNRTNQPLIPFYDGAFKMALQMGAPIAVQTVSNIHAVTQSTLSVDLSPGTIHIYWSEPIAAKGLKAEHLDLLKAQVTAEMLRHLQPESA